MTKTIHTALLALAFATAANADLPNTRTGVFFTLPGTNGFVKVSADSLCWGKSPQTFKKITPASMITVLDAFAERYYVMWDQAVDPDREHRYWAEAWHGLNVLTPNMSDWKSLDFLQEYWSNPWPAASNRNFSAALRIFPRGYDMLQTVRESLRSMVDGRRHHDGAGSLAFWPFGMFGSSDRVGSSLFGSDKTVDIGWCSNEAYQVELFEARTNGYGKCYAWFKEALNTNSPSFVGCMPSIADDDGRYNDALWSNLVDKAESLKTTLEGFLPDADGGLSDDWLPTNSAPARILASDFSWMNALLMSMDTSYSFAGPEPRFWMRDSYVAGATNAYATIVLDNLHVATSGETPYLVFDAEIGAWNHGDVPVQTNAPIVANSAIWALGDANVGVSAGYFVTNEVYMARADFVNALLNAGFDSVDDWTAVDMETISTVDGIYIIFRDPDDYTQTHFLHLIPWADIAALGGTKSVSNAEYSVSVQTRTPVSDLACLPFARQGQSWYSRNLSAPSLTPSTNTAGLVRSVKVQGYATWSVEGFNTNGLDRVMACGASAEVPTGDGASAAADRLLTTRMMPGREEEANRLASVSDLRRPKGIETQLKANLLASSQKGLVVGFVQLDLHVIPDGEGGLAIYPDYLDAQGNIKIGQMAGGVTWNDSRSLPDGSCVLFPSFSLLTVYDFNNLPAPRSQP